MPINWPDISSKYDPVRSSKGNFLSSRPTLTFDESLNSYHSIEKKRRFHILLFVVCLTREVVDIGKIILAINRERKFQFSSKEIKFVSLLIETFLYVFSR